MGGVVLSPGMTLDVPWFRDTLERSFHLFAPLGHLKDTLKVPCIFPGIFKDICAIFSTFTKIEFGVH